MSASGSARPAPAVFFDRDGVVNRSPGPGYVLRWEEFVFAPGIFDLLRLVRGRGWLAVLVTSQNGVGKGLMPRAELDRIHRLMQERLQREAGGGFDAIYACTGEPGCPWPPKPHPGMIHAAARDLGADLARSWLIGDADRDIAMARAAGLAGTIRVRGDQPVTEPATRLARDLLEVQALLLDLAFSGGEAAPGP